MFVCVWQRSVSAPTLRMTAGAATEFDIKNYFATMLPKVEAALSESMDVLPREWFVSFLFGATFCPLFRIP